MGRKRKIETDEMLSFVDQYRMEYPDEKITPPKLGRYIRNQGRDIPDHLIRRDGLVTRYIEEKNQGSINIALQTVSSYKTIDVDCFLDKNRTQSRLKKALMERDRYYNNVAQSAAKIFKQYKSVVEELESEKQKTARLEMLYSDLQQKKQKKSEATTNKTIHALSKIIKTHIYPEIANELLRKAGLIDFSGDRVFPDSVLEETVDVQTDVIDKADSISARLMKGFED